MRNIYQEHELEAYLGESAEDFDIEAIVDEATEVDYKTGNRYWRDGIDLAAICEKHDTAAGGQATVTAELYRRDTGSTMSAVDYSRHATLDEIKRDLREGWCDWDYAIVSGYADEDVIIERAEG